MNESELNLSMAILRLRICFYSLLATGLVHSSVNGVYRNENFDPNLREIFLIKIRKRIEIKIKNIFIIRNRDTYVLSLLHSNFYFCFHFLNLFIFLLFILR